MAYPTAQPAYSVGQPLNFATPQGIPPPSAINNAVGGIAPPPGLNFATPAPAVAPAATTVGFDTPAIGTASVAIPGMPETSNPGAVTPAAPGPSMFNNITTGLDTLSGLTQAYTGLETLGLAQDRFDFTSDAYNQDIANQAKLTNSELSDRQDRRNSGSSNESLQSTEEYIAQNGVSGAAIG